MNPERTTSPLRYLVEGEAVIKDVGRMTFTEPVTFHYKVTGGFNLLLDYEPLDIHLCSSSWSRMFQELEREMEGLLDASPETERGIKARKMIRYRTWGEIIV